ncbi:hypothetical protein [Sphingomonas sp. GB1N7]|uniref:hypothetical protein n=1 Tax=Parasphingomonas caseinilytica TaxID=3096158 RepID=UPI002FC81A0D
MTETTTIFTFAQFVLMGVFAVLVIFGILFGMRLKRRRLEAEAEVEEHREALGEIAEPDTDVPAEVAKPEVAAAPPPAPTPAPAPVEPEKPVAPPVAAEPETTTSPIAAEPAEPVVENIAPPPPPAPPARPAVPLAGEITQLKGLGPKLAATLAQLGVTRVDQIAAMTPAQLLDLDIQLGAFKGRPARDRWAEQARLLVAGDKAAYEAEFGKLGG